MSTASLSELVSTYTKVATGTFLEQDRNSNFPNENTIKPTREQVKAWVRESNHSEPMFYQVACMASEWSCLQQQLKLKPTMTEEQIQMLRRLIKDEVEAASIDGMEHGTWGWAEKQLDENWKEFQESFTDPGEQECQAFNSIEELFENLHADERLWLKKRLNEENQEEQITWQGEPLNTKDENDLRFKECMETINNLKPGELEQLMGEGFMEEFKRVST
jgi:hypothetical protein